MTAADQLDEQVRHLMLAGDLEQAARLCDQLNAQFPGFAPGWFTTSRVALRVGRPAVGIKAIDRALSLAPGKPEWLLQRIECMVAAGDNAGATTLARHLSELQLDNAQLASHFGQLLGRLELYEEAVRQCRRAVELDPDNGRHHYNLAAVLRYTGDIGEAARAVAECIRLDPDDTDAYLLAAGLQIQTAEENNVEALEAAHARSAGDPARRLRVCYALAKELDDLGDYARAFDFLAEGSALRREQISYDLSADIAMMQAIQSTIGPEQIARNKEGYVNAEPIFLVGMPRTGTMLVQRVLAAHPVVQPAGEQLLFPSELLKRFRQAADGQEGTVAELLARAQSVDFAAVGEAYVEAARPTAESTAHFVDSMALNFIYAGMIHMALPKARIVLLRRHPMDSCYAAFTTLFTRAYPFSYDLTELAKYFVAFHEISDHWLELMPDTIHVVAYEELVTSPRPVIERLLEHCALSLEDACVNFFDDKSTAPSPSAAQLRRAFSRASIGGWRNYEEQLRPVAEILQKAGISID